MKLETSIVLAGVGGQGTLIAGKLLGILAMKLGLDVKVSEVHGMSQRGGSVITYVRIGNKVNSPIIEEGMADYVIAFEKVEAIRWSNLLKKGGVMIVNDQEIKSLPVLIGKEEYPNNIIESLKSAFTEDTMVEHIDAYSLALESGSSKAVNIVLMGLLGKHLGVDYDIWTESIKEAFSSKPQTIEGNINAFNRGFYHI